MTSLTQPDVTASTPDTPAQPERRLRALHGLLVIALLLAMFGLMLGTALAKTPAAGEGLHAVRGWAFWRTGTLLPGESLPLPDMIAGLGGLLEPTLPAPQTLTGWQSGDAGTMADALLWGTEGVNTARLVFLFRVPGMLLAVLLGAVLWRWAYSLYGRWGAVMVLALYALSPTIIGYASLAVPAFLRAAFSTGALVAWLRYLHRQTLGWLIAAGLFFGLALASGFAALLLIPIFIVMALWNAAQHAPLRLDGAEPLSRGAAAVTHLPLGWLWSALLVVIIIAGLGGLVLAGVLASLHPPDLISAYVEIINRTIAAPVLPVRPYMFGRLSAGGWLYDVFLLLAMKLPLPTLAVVLVALILLAARRPSRREWEVIFPGLLFLAASLLDPLGRDLRTVLPLLVLIFVFAGRVGAGERSPRWLHPALTSWLVLSLAAVNAVNTPDALSFFNLVGGGPDNASEMFVGPNSDMGQDLGALADYLQERSAGMIYLSYFGDADPAAYGIDYRALPGSTQPGGARADFPPLNPAPGLYAISVTNLVGAGEGVDADTFGYFLAREPVARIGGSIYVYEVASAVRSNGGGEGPWLAYCASMAGIDDMTGLTGLLDLDVFAFDCESSLAFWPGEGWLVMPASVEPVIDLGAPDYVSRDANGQMVYRAWRADGPPAAPQTRVEFPPVSLPLPIAGYLELTGWQTNVSSLAPGDDLLFTTWWRIREPPTPPVSLFARLEMQNGQEVAAADALGVGAEDWRPGMVLIQEHRFTLGNDVAPGSYRLTTGLFVPTTGRRFPVFRSEDREIDRVMLRAIDVTE